MDETDLIEFKSYRFPNKTFVFTKQDLKKFRELEGEILEKEAELYDLIRDKGVKKVDG